MGRVLVGVGLTIAFSGVLLMLLERFHLLPGRLPGDIVLRAKDVTVYFPVVTCVVLSLLGTLALWLFNRR